MRKMIVCFGDSNTWGYDTEHDSRFDEDTRWPGVLAKELGDDFLVREEGLCGRNTVFEDPLTEAMAGISTIYPVLMTHAAVDLLIIMLGTNDTKQRFAATPTNIAAGLSRLVKKAKATECWGDHEPRILIVCPPPILPVYKERIFAGEMGEGCDEKSRALAPLFRQAAMELGCSYVDAGEIAGVMMSERLCGMHMEADVHERLAKALADKVREILT